MFFIIALLLICRIHNIGQMGGVFNYIAVFVKSLRQEHCPRNTRKNTEKGRKSKAKKARANLCLRRKGNGERQKRIWSRAKASDRRLLKISVRNPKAFWLW